MQEMHQGEEYEESGVDAGDEQYEGENSEDTNNKITTIYGIPKVAFFIGLAVLGVAILVAILFITRKSKTSEDNIVYPEENTIVEDLSQDTSVPMESVVKTECYDTSGMFIGYCDGASEGFSIYTDIGEVVGFIEQSGTETFHDSTGNVLGYYTPMATQDFTSEETYTESSEDTELLRKMGYTGDEIELALSSGTPIDVLVEEAQKAHDEAAKEALARMSDTASEEYQFIYNNSIFSLPELTFDEFDATVEGAERWEGSYVVNADYAKVPTYGNQLWIKVKIANNTYAHHLVTPDRWSTLPETGNIVMKVNYTMYGTNVVNMYITRMEEVSSTLITVNPEDSASELADIISEDNTSYNDSTDEAYEEDSIDNGTQYWW